ncbi:hypothetical protein RDWZM_003933 [Blomia tropicalis]|uniref:SGTA homodimerisation domain-containing protein n=1 Tax=Blomia tropicalis TaxID=40697 RepID=A0A9Q0MHS9_BLOTA|nr:hypothetical protein BLOT_013544 [Blomia tropicalis]KAJ6225388.1 hypothetical protein RDWZM_003933 [Blomia tropicalis]
MSAPSLKQSLVASFMQFLTDEIGSESLSEDAKESIEVALQCLETAYEINPVDGSLCAKKPLLEIFKDHQENKKEPESKTTISDEDKAKADQLKNNGNELMKNGKFKEALDAYTKAIEIDNTNPIYYCNRAAANSKLDNHQAALEDCRIAIKHDPNYSKAYCRMGLAYVNLNDHLNARNSYKKAVDLDPSENNISNLNLAEQKLKEQQDAMSSGFNLGNILNNPSLMSFASQMMSDPNMQNMLSGFMNNAMGQQNPNEPNEPNRPETEPANADGPGGIEAFLQAGQQFAAQMQAQNPELVEQLKSAFKKQTEGDDSSKSGPQ